jgi:hypothetical protein
MNMGAAGMGEASTVTYGMGAIEGLVKNAFKLYDIKKMGKLGLNENDRIVTDCLIRSTNYKPVTKRDIMNNTPLTYSQVSDALDRLDKKRGVVVKFTIVDAYAFCKQDVPEELVWLRHALRELGGGHGNSLSWDQKIESNSKRYPYVYVPLFKVGETPVYASLNFSLMRPI